MYTVYENCSELSIACTGNPNQMCGGGYRMNIYSVDRKCLSDP